MKLKELRESRGITQAQLADAVGVGDTTISMIETGKNRPSVNLAKRFAEYFDVAWYIFFD